MPAVSRIMAGNHMIREKADAFRVTATCKELEGSDADVAGGNPREHGTGKHFLAVDLLAREHCCESPCGGTRSHADPRPPPSAFGRTARRAARAATRPWLPTWPYPSRCRCRPSSAPGCRSRRRPSSPRCARPSAMRGRAPASVRVAHVRTPSHAASRSNVAGSRSSPISRMSTALAAPGTPSEAATAATVTGLSPEITFTARAGRRSSASCRPRHGGCPRPARRFPTERASRGAGRHR